MALPNNKRGFRKIIVDSQPFSWRFSSGLIDIRPASYKGNKLLVDFGWWDPFAYFGADTVPPPFEPKVVTPVFVKQAIEFGIASGLDNNSKTGIFNVKYSNKQFGLALT
jgi:hypothetical protein